MKIETTRFGIMDIPEDQIVTLKGGLLGFSECTRFALVPEVTDSPFQWLQSLDMPSLALAVADPAKIPLDYHFSLEDSAVQDLGSIQLEDFHVFVVVTGGDTLQDFTVNLLGPILINKNTRLGRQIVLTDSTYRSDHPLFGGVE